MRVWLCVMMFTFVCVLVGFGSTDTVEAGIVTDFDQSEYRVGLNETFQVQVVFDMDDDTPGNQLPDAGLFSTGILLSYDGTAFQISEPDGMTIPSDLNSDGIGGLADTLFGDGEVGFAGALSLAASAGYQDSLLVTFDLTSTTLGDFTLALDRFYPTKTNTMDFDGNDLDSQITFGSATVTVVPEPSSLLLAFGAIASLVGLQLLRRKQTNC